MSKGNFGFVLMFPHFLFIAGMSRSATIVIAYLMKTRGMSFQDALALVKARRPIVRPNEKFVKQLKDFEMQLALKERSADSP